MLSVVLPMVLFFTVLAVVASLAMKERSSRRTSITDWPFYAKVPLTQAEQVLYHRLIEALPEHFVLAHVPLSQILGVKKGFNFNEWSNRINRLSYHFVVCAKDSRVVVAIELEDKTQEHAASANADRRKESATISAGIKFIRWQASALPDAATIRLELINAAI